MVMSWFKLNDALLNRTYIDCNIDMLLNSYVNEGLLEDVCRVLARTHKASFGDCKRAIGFTGGGYIDHDSLFCALLTHRRSVKLLF